MCVFRTKFLIVLRLTSYLGYALIVVVSRDPRLNAVQSLLMQKKALFPKQHLLKFRPNYCHSSLVDQRKIGQRRELSELWIDKSFFFFF